MTLRRLAAAAALLALTVSRAPAVAAPATRTLTVTGSGNTYVEVTMPARFRLYRDDFDGGPRPRFTGKGDYAGVYVESLRTPGLVSGSVLLRAMPGWQTFPLGLGADTLPAGRYRVHLLGKGAGSVRLAVSGLRRDLTVRTTARRSLVSARLVHRTVAGVTAPVDRTVIPFTMRPATTTVLAAAHDSTGAVGDQRVCVGAGGDQLPCPLNGGGFTSYGTPGRYGIASAYFLYPGDLPAGEAAAEYVDTTVGVPGGMWAFALTIS